MGLLHDPDVRSKEQSSATVARQRSGKAETIEEKEESDAERNSGKG
jgi:hypothetical protein